MPTLPAASVPEALALAQDYSGFLSRELNAKSWLGDYLPTRLQSPLTQQDLLAFLQQPPRGLGLEAIKASDQVEPLKQLLRYLRAWVISHVLTRDVAGWAPLGEVVETMTVLADVTVGVACEVLRHQLAQRYGQPCNAAGEEQPFVIVGMGKLGGRELNASSDIDLIYLYPEDGDTQGGPRSLSNYEFFTRLGRSLINALHEVTGDGQVFRVDMRLRPNGDSGPLVCSFDMLENYFITQGREWERYAWIKARVMVGEECIPALRPIVRPFIYRKYLDFGAINAMRDLHAQIRREVERRDRANNVKLGPGGIREIEFIAQVFQLIRGGRDTALQIRPTLQVLGLLPERGLISTQTLAELRDAYDFLRRVEHRLQYLQDAQTHDLPTDEPTLLKVAQAMDFPDIAAFMAVLDGHRTRVSHYFADVFGDPAEEEHALDGLWAGACDEEDCGGRFASLGFAQPAEAAGRLAALRNSGRYQQMPANIRSRFDALMPRVVEVAAQTPNPDDTLTRLLVLMETISRRGAYLALLQQYPQALTRVAELASSSSWAAEYLTRHPLLLDELLLGGDLSEDIDIAQVSSKLGDELAALGNDTERQMDVMREQHHAAVFRLLSQDLAGHLTVEALADYLSALADAMLELTIQYCWPKVLIRHRDDPQFAVISYGKLGGKELGYASDLDIVFIYDDEHPRAGEIYARLAQRMNTWLSSQTSAGSLFETDLRLRPNGEAGLMVVSLEAFRQYQLEAAWIWEHQALTRARFSAGNPALGERFETVRREVLAKPRDLAELRQAVVEMRAKMLAQHGSKDDKFHLKHDPGGIIDVEFIVQYLVLAHSREHAGLLDNLGNIALLHLAGELGLIDVELADRVAEAYRSFRAHQHRARLNGLSLSLDADALQAERSAVQALWLEVLGARD